MQALFSDKTIRPRIRGQTNIPPYFQSDWKWPVPYRHTRHSRSHRPRFELSKFTPQTVPQSEVGQRVTLYKVTTCRVNDVGGEKITVKGYQFQ